MGWEFLLFWNVWENLMCLQELWVLVFLLCLFSEFACLTRKFEAIGVGFCQGRLLVSACTRIMLELSD